MARPLVPLNSITRRFFVETTNPDDGTVVPFTAGTVTAFLATSEDPDATALDPSVQVTPTHIGLATPGTGQYPLGWWLFTIPANVLTAGLLDPLFAPPAPNAPGKPVFLLVQVEGVLRRSELLVYKRAERA